MRLVEFTVKWSGNYSEEQISTYEIMHGEDRDKWPKTDDIDKIVIDVDRIARFNPNDDDTCTTVELVGARAYCICMPYEEFKSILQFLNVEITNFKDAILDRNK